MPSAPRRPPRTRVDDEGPPPGPEALDCGRLRRCRDEDVPIPPLIVSFEVQRSRPEDEHRDARSLDLGLDRSGKGAWRGGEGDHPITRDRWNPALQGVLVALVLARPDQPGLAAPVPA